MKKILLILSFLIPFLVHGQTTPTTVPPASPQQMLTNSVYQDAVTKKYYVYNGTTFLWRQLTDSIEVARMIANSPSGSVTSFNGRTGIVTFQSSDGSSYYPLLSGEYTNPSWITSLAYSKITGAPTVYQFTGTTAQYTDGTGAYQTIKTDLGQFTNTPGYLTNATGDSRYYPLSSNPANYLTSSNGVIWLATIAQMQAYNGAAKTIVVTDPLRGGVFNSVTGSTTPDNGITFPSAISGTYLQRQLTPSMSINVSWYGAISDASTTAYSGTDNTTAIQAAYNAASATGLHLFMNGKYLVTHLAYNLPNVSVDMAPGTYIVSPQGTDTLRHVIDITGNNNVINGDGAYVRNYPYTSGQQRHNVAILGGTGITINGLSVQNGGGDGFYIGNSTTPLPTNIVLNNVRTDSCWRNGIAVVNGVNIIINHPTMLNSRPSGIYPHAGMDIEPNAGATDQIHGLKVVSPYTSGNYGVGINCATLLTVNLGEKTTDITITDHYSLNDGKDGNQGGLSITGNGYGAIPTFKMDGVLVYTRGRIINPGGSGIYYNSMNPTFAPLARVDAYIENPGQFATTNIDKAGLLIFGGGGATFLNGNGVFDIKTADTRTTPVLFAPVYINNTNQGVSNIQCTLDWDGNATSGFGYVQSSATSVTNTNLFYKYTQTYTSSGSIGSSSVLNSTGAVVFMTAGGTYPMPSYSTVIGQTFTIKNGSSTAVTISPFSGETLPSTGTATNAILAGLNDLISYKATTTGWEIVQADNRLAQLNASNAFKFQNTFTSGADGNAAIVVKRNSSITTGSNLLDFQDQLGAGLSSVDPLGNFRTPIIGSYTSLTNGQIAFTPTGIVFTHGLVDANPGFTFNNLGTGNFLWQYNNVSKATLSAAGMFGGAGISNLATGNNATVNTSASGTTVTRNIADAGVTLGLTQSNILSTGHILDVNNATGSKPLQVYVNGNMDFGGLTGTSPSVAYQFEQAVAGQGLIAYTASSGTVTGTNTQFTNDFKIGDQIKSNGETHTISSITNDALMTTDAWTNSSITSAPITIATSVIATGGTLSAGTYYYVVSALNGTGETIKSPESIAVTTGSTSSVAVTWTAVPGATSYKIFRGTSSGAENVFYTSTAASFTDVNGTSTAGTPLSVSTAGGTTAQYTLSGGASFQIYRNKNITIPTFTIAGLVSNSASGLLSTTTALPNGITAITQTPGTSNNTVATTQFVTNAVSGIPTNPMTALGDMIRGGTAGAQTRLPGNTTTAQMFLAQTGTGTVSAAPAWVDITGIFARLNAANIFGNFTQTYTDGTNSSLIDPSGFTSNSGSILNSFKGGAVGLNIGTTGRNGINFKGLSNTLMMVINDQNGGADDPNISIAYPLNVYNPGSAIGGAGFYTQLATQTATSSNTQFLQARPGVLLDVDQAPSILSTITGVNAKTVGSTLLYTVPTGKHLVVTGLEVVPTTSTSPTTGPTVNVAATTAGTIYSSVSLSATTSTTQVYSFATSGMYALPNAADTINFNITTGATATTLTYTLILRGYLE